MNFWWLSNGVWGEHKVRPYRKGFFVGAMLVIVPAEAKA